MTQNKTFENDLNSDYSLNTRELEDRYEIQIYPRRPVTITRGQGIYLWDDTDKRYFDCVSGWGSANIGHSNDYIAEKIYEQSKRLISCPGIFYNDVRAKLAAKLVEISPDGLNRVFFQNSGTESVEAALKFAMLTTKKSKFISIMRSFHGRSLGSLSVTFNSKYKSDYIKYLPTNRVSFVPLNNMSKLKDAVNSDIAAIILEPIQGEGGVHIAEDKYLREVKEVCEENNILLIVDEVQTGFGRTGTMFAIEPSGVIPDILCLAKSIAAGVPMGAVLVSDKINVPRGKHGSTFGGNPLSSAAALANIAFIKENNLVENAKVNGTYFLNLLKEEILDIPLVRNIRGVGLMIGIEFKKDIKTLIDELLIQGLLVIPTGKTVIRLLPPIIINQAQIDQIVQILKEILLNH